MAEAGVESDLMDFKKTAVDVILRQLKESFSRQEISAALEIPPLSDFGDYAFPCFIAAKKLKKSPQELAKQLAKTNLPEGIEKIEAKGPYVNFYLDSTAVAKETISAILKNPDSFGRLSHNSGKKAMVEYSQPNPNKPLHLGHLRNDSIGMAFSKLLEATGFEVIKANLISDRGIHICQAMIAYMKFGQGKTPKSEKIKGDRFVGDYYVLFHKNAKENPEFEKEAQEMLRKWEAGDKEIRALWKKMRDWALEGFKETYEKIGSKFDVFFYESDFYHKAQPIFERGLKAGVFFKDKDGALVAKLKPHGLPDKIVLRGDGTSIYITNDLVLTEHKFEQFELDKSFWVVASEQDLYFKQLFKIFELLGHKFSEKCEHLSYGLVNLPEGKMKSREGKVIDADDLLQEIEDLAKIEIEERYSDLTQKEKTERAKAISLAAIKFFMLKADAKKDFVFDAKKSISFEGDSGPYALYTFARAKSIIRKANEIPNLARTDFSLLSSAHEKVLAKLLRRFPGIIADCEKHRSLHILCQYLLDVCGEFNSFYHESPVIEADNELKSSRLALVSATAELLKQGLSILNIEAIERM